MSAVAPSPVDEAEATRKATDPTETIVPSVPTPTISFGPKDADGVSLYTYVQKPLSFFGKMDFFSVMGKALDLTMSGNDGISVADLLEVPEDVTDLKDADTFIRGIAKLASYSPDMLADLYCVILQVPRGERTLARAAMQMPADEGGFTDDQGIGVIATFLDQNWDVLRDFFTGQIAGLVEKVQGKMPKKDGESESSKP